MAFGATASADTYTVKSGDTLSEIAVKHDTSLSKILENNHFKNIHLIHIGDKIELDNKIEKNETKTEIVAEVETEEPAVVTPEPVVAEAPTSSKEVETPVSNSAKDIIAYRESRGDYNVTNGKYIGRFQLDSAYLNGDHSPANQERVADKYVSERYGSWDAALVFWNANGWY